MNELPNSEFRVLDPELLAHLDEDHRLCTASTAITSSS